MPYVVSEPAPSVSATGYTHSGRGGAGNTFRPAATASSSSSSTAPRVVPAPKVSAQRFYSGIGGYGNAHSASERKALSFEEDFNRARVRETASAVHVGVGGAGNIYRKNSAASAGSDSESTRRLSAEPNGFWGRLSSGSYTRH